MGSIFQFATDGLLDTLPWKGTTTQPAERHTLRFCRAIDCEQVAKDDDFCPRCREEIDALRAMPPWRPKRRQR